MRYEDNELNIEQKTGSCRQNIPPHSGYSAALTVEAKTNKGPNHTRHFEQMFR